MNKGLLLLSKILLVLFILSSCRKTQEQERIKSGEEITIIVATDLHYLSNELHDDGEAFQNYYQFGDGKQLNYVEEIINAFVDELKQKKPDILIISGDLTNNGEKQSHLDLAKKLTDIENQGIRVYVTPGNHDILNPWSVGFKADKKVKVKHIKVNEFKKIYRKFGLDEAISKDQYTLSYLAAPSDDLWLLILDTNNYQFNMLNGSPATEGEISQETIEWIKACSERAKKENAKLLTVKHHNLLNHNDVLNDGFTIDNNSKVVKVFQDYGLKLTLSGHIHIQDIKSVGEVENTIYDIVTSSLSVHPFQYGVLKFNHKGFEYNVSSVDVESWAKGNSINDDHLLNFKQYSKEFFYTTSYNKTFNKLTEMGVYTEEEKAIMSETMAKLNVHFFAGTVNEIREEIIKTDGYKLLVNATRPSFLKDYVLSIVNEGVASNTSIKIATK